MKAKKQAKASSGASKKPPRTTAAKAQKSAARATGRNGLISRRRGVCEGHPYITGLRIPVWLLENSRRVGYTEANLLREYPYLQKRHLKAAWEYVRTHAQEIEEQIEANTIKPDPDAASKVRVLSPDGLIVSRPGVCGGRPRIQGTRIDLWVLEGYRRLGYTDRDLLETYPQLSQQHLDAAWEYVRLHPMEIEEQIRANEM